jgi:hypothetical protein
MQVVYERCAGLDVHQASIKAVEWSRHQVAPGNKNSARLAP